MTHRFPIKEIAQQAGLSTATVDRALNKRAHVSPQTRRRVSDAISELEGQETQLSARGRRMFIDFVVEAPARFSREIRHATEDVLPAFNPAVIRPRFNFKERMSEEECAAILKSIAKRGSQGVCIKARDLPAIREGISELMKKGIPVVTIFTDISGSDRLAYAGLDNFNAGRTAAYLFANMLSHTNGTVLTTKSDTLFQGEDDRYQGFCEVMAHLRPDLHVLDASGGAGLNASTAQKVELAISNTPDICAVYSMGGGNTAIQQVLENLKRKPDVFIAHDLDADNLRLLREGKITVVLQHDLREDIRIAFLHMMAHHKLVKLAVPPTASDIQIITPMNIPSRFDV
ncbi:LacI family transcriptional regulator [Rhodobacterales bacterium 52_120_T64]|nr:LacI family transcriptional regulator [Rhodobacterales bacterium 52_120_T64]